MINTSFPADDSLDLEIRLTTRVLTHKLIAQPFGSAFEKGALFLCEQTIVEKFVPPFPINELWEILNSINNRDTSPHKEAKNCVETNSGVCLTTEARSSLGDEEEKFFPREGNVPSASHRNTPERPDHRLVLTSKVPADLVSESNPNEKEQKVQKYEKKNIYYKAVFRDIRRYFIELLSESPPKCNLKSKLINLLSTLDSSLKSEQIEAMISVLAPFLNYNGYMIEFDQKDKEVAQCIHDCLQNFTLTKMRKVLKYHAIKTLVKYYFAHTVENGVSERFSKHKTMQFNTHKYLQVLEKILSLTD